MPRAVALGVALSLLAAACALAEAPPDGAVTFQAVVRNVSAQDLNLQVTAQAGTTPLGRAVPDTLLPSTRMDVTFYVPADQDWMIVLAPGNSVSKSDYEEFAGRLGCRFSMELSGDGGFAYGCE